MSGVSVGVPLSCGSWVAVQQKKIAFTMLQLKLKDINSAVSLKIYQYIHHGRNHCKNYDKESFKICKVYIILYVTGPGGLV